MRKINEEIIELKTSMKIQPERIAYLMRNERISTMQVEELMEMAQKLDYVTPSVSRAYQQFDSTRCKSDRLDSLSEHNLKLIETMAKIGKDNRVYTMLMAAYSLCGNAFRANALLRTMKDARIAPTREIYNLLISVNGKEGDLEKCTKHFNEMVAFGYEPNANSWNTLLFLHGRKGDVYECAQLYDKMRTQGVAKCKSTYDVLLRIFAKKGLLKTCDKIWLEMENFGISRDALTFNLLIEGHAANGGLAQCAELMEEMRAQGIAPDTQTYTAYIRACAQHHAQSGGIDAHAAGIDAYTRMRNEGVVPNILTYRSALACFMGKNAWDQCVNLVADMEARGVESDAHMYRMMLEVCTRMGDARVTRAVLEEMKKRKIEVETVTKNKDVKSFSDVIIVSERKSEKEEEEVNEDREGEEDDYTEIFQQIIREQLNSKD